MKFQKKMIILTTAAVATFGLIACGAAVADSKKDDGAVKPMAMKSAVLPNFVFIRLLLWIPLQLQPLR